MCIENNLNRSQFYYYKRRLEKITEGKEPIFKAISLKSKTDVSKKDNPMIKEVQINIGNVNISIPVSEANRFKWSPQLSRLKVNLYELRWILKGYEVRKKSKFKPVKPSNYY